MLWVQTSNVDEFEIEVLVVELKGSRTYANLMSAYAGESQAYTKYRIYAEKAKKDGFEEIADIFERTADNEKAHATIWFKHIHNDQIDDTQVNLQDAAAGEHFEWTEMYKEYAEVAKEEGFTQIAKEMELIAEIEHAHEDRYNTKETEVKNSEVFRKEEKTVWICRNCGYVYEGESAPMVCPVCKYPQAYFQEKKECY